MGTSVLQARKRSISIRHAVLLLGSTALAGTLGPVVPAHAQSATWQATPADSVYSNGANWIGGTPATGFGNTATFGTSTTTTVTLDNSLDIGAFRVQDGAAYTFNYGAPATSIRLDGMDIQPGASATFNLSNGVLFQFLSGSAQTATFVNNATLEFQNGSNAGSAVITNNNVLSFYGGSWANNAIITTAAGGTVGFFDVANGGSATFVFTGNGNLDISGLGFSSTFVGSIASASTTSEVWLGAKRLDVGNNNTSTTFEGVISGIGGSLRKIGAGTLTLTNVNTYTGGTIINGGALAISDDNNLGAASGGLTISGGTLRLNSSVTSARQVTFAGVGEIDTNGNSLTLSGVAAGNVLVKAGTGTLTLTNAANTFTHPTFVNAGTMAVAAGGALTSLEVVNSAAFSNAGTVTANLTNNALANLTNSGTWTGNVQSNASAITNTGTWNGNAVGNATGQFSNFGTWNGSISNAFLLMNASTWNGDAVNTGSISNQATWNGNLTNSSFSSFVENEALWNGAISNSGTFRNTLNGVVTGPIINTGSVQAYAGTLNGAIANNAGSFTVLGTVISNNTFTNAAGAALNIISAGNYTLNGLIANAGTVFIVPGGIFTTNGGIDNTASGVWNGNIVSNAPNGVRNNGIINGNVTMNGGTLGGTGTIAGDLTVAGATFAPGNSIGTFTVQGNLAFTTASTYLIEIDPTSSDRTNVTGSATLGGATVHANYASGSYVARRYTILNAGGVNGTFNSLVNTNLPSSFTASLSYDPNNVYLDLKLLAPNFGSGLNTNQTNVANALVNSFNTAGGIPLVFGALTPTGLTQVSGEAATGLQQTTFDAMGQFTSLLVDPLMGERGTGAPQGGASSYADEAAAYAPTRKGRSKAEQEAYAAMARKAPSGASDAQRWSVWGAGYGATQSTDGNAATGSSDTRARIYGSAAGFDYRLSPDTLIGFALGGASTKYNLTNGTGGGSSEMFQAGVYGRHDLGPAYIAGALAYGWQDVTTDRSVFLNSLRANFDANALSGRLEAGRRFATGLGGLTPYAAGQFTSFFLPAYAEQVIAGVNTFALSYSEKDVTTSRSELGLRADTSFAMQDAAVILRGRAAWAHNFSTDRSISAIFQTLPASSFVVTGASPARDAALISASAETKWRNGFSVAASFEGEFSNVTESYAGKGIVRYQW